MAIKKVKLNYMPIAPEVHTISKTSVSRSKLEELDIAIKQKIKQNESERAASKEMVERYTVR